MILFTNVEQMLGIGVKFYFYNNSSKVNVPMAGHVPIPGQTVC